MILDEKNALFNEEVFLFKWTYKGIYGRTDEPKYSSSTHPKIFCLVNEKEGTGQVAQEISMDIGHGRIKDR